MNNKVTTTEEKLTQQLTEMFREHCSTEIARERKMPKYEAKAVGYCRVACADENTNDEFLRQETLIAQKAAKLNLEVVEYFHETGKPSGVLEDVFEYFEVEGDIANVIVSDMTRLSRDYHEANAIVGRFRDLGYEVATVEDSSIEKFVTNMNKALGAHDEEYRRRHPIK